MLYKSDFKTSTIHFIGEDNDNNGFSVIVKKNFGKRNISQNSLAIAAKPLTCFASVFGSCLIRYTKTNIARVSLWSTLYSLSIALAMATLMLVKRPASWQDTRTDIPLNILTKTFSFVDFTEAIYSVFIITFANSGHYVKLFKTLEDIDLHFNTSKLMFRKRRQMSVFLILLPIIQVSCTFYLRKFQIQNIGAHLAFFLLMLQGAVFSFLIINIYINQLILNNILASRIFEAITIQKKIVYRDSIRDFLIKKIFIGSKITDRCYIKHYCWFELMQIYDKLTDCLGLFNQIYSGQVFLMYNSWLLCTLLIICRSLSPSIKYSELFLSDLFLYSCINVRPLILASMCELFMRERKKTVSILVEILLQKIGDEYYDQIQTMIMLVESRKLEVSANVFTVNVPTVMKFAGNIISYTVLMIQYFYMHQFAE